MPESGPSPLTGCPAGTGPRRRLLAAAAHCFAERGFAGASVRVITGLAGCNVGAVNYHFGGKRNLYVRVFEERLSELSASRVGALTALQEGETPSVEHVIETFARAFLEPLRTGEQGRETIMLIMREMIDAELPPAVFAQHLVEPTLAALRSALARACPRLDPGAAALCCHSLIAQLVHVVHVRRLEEHNRRPPPSDRVCALDDIVQHVVRFTAAGVRGCLPGTGR